MIALLALIFIHYFHTTSQSKRGEQVTANTLTTNFKKARNKTDIDWGEGTPATFHEQRSLSERLYRAQGINTKDLLGHKTKFKQINTMMIEGKIG